MIVGLHFSIPARISRADFVRAWATWIQRESQAAGLDTGDNFLSIELPCGESVAYKTTDDVPLVDVPCACGVPEHWFIKYEVAQ